MNVGAVLRMGHHGALKYGLKDRMETKRCGVRGRCWYVFVTKKIQNGQGHLYEMSLEGDGARARGRNSKLELYESHVGRPHDLNGARAVVTTIPAPTANHKGCEV